MLLTENLSTKNLLYGRSFILMALKHNMLSENSQKINIIILLLWNCNTEKVSSTTWEEMWIYNFSRLCLLNLIWLFAIPWMRAYQAPLSVEFSRQEYWSRYHLLFQGIFLTQGSNLSLLRLLHWQVDFLPLHHLGSPNFSRASVKRREFRKSILYTTCIFIINVCLDQRNYP